MSTPKIPVDMPAITFELVPDDTPVCGMTERQIDGLLRHVMAAAAQAGADALMTDLAERGLLRTGAPVEVATVVRDDAGRITGIVREHQ